MHAAWVKNMLPHNAIGGEIPGTLWSGSKVSVRSLRVWGCKAFVHIPDKQRSKFEPKACPVVHLGYDPMRMSYRLWDVNQRKMVVSREVTFLELEKGSS